MIGQETLLVTLVKLVTRIPLPPRARQARARDDPKPTPIACSCKRW